MSASSSQRGRIEAGGKISAPGVYDLTFETYFDDCCVGPSVSSTGLKTIEHKSLAHFWWASYMNPKREPIDTNALRFGRACHSWILGIPEFQKAYIVSPYDTFHSKEARTWRDAQEKTVVKAADMVAIDAMAAALIRHPLLRNAFADGLPERSIVFMDKETGLWIKTRPDWLPNKLHFVPDLKSTISAKPEAFTRQAFALGYHQSAALTLDGLREVLGWKDSVYYFVAQEKEPPYVAIPFLMREHDIELGRMLNRSALRKLARALDADHWPAYAEGAVEICMPSWSEKQILDRNEAGEFAETQKDAAE